MSTTRPVNSPTAQGLSSNPYRPNATVNAPASIPKMNSALPARPVPEPTQVTLGTNSVDDESIAEKFPTLDVDEPHLAKPIQPTHPAPVARPVTPSVGSALPGPAKAAPWQNPSASNNYPVPAGPLRAQPVSAPLQASTPARAAAAAPAPVSAPAPYVPKSSPPISSAAPLPAGASDLASDLSRTQSELRYVRDRNDLLSKEIDKLKAENTRLKLQETDKKHLEELRRENERLSRELKGLKALAPFQQNETTAEVDQVSRLQSRVSELEAMIAGTVNPYQQLTLPSSQVATRQLIQLPQLNSPKKVTPAATVRPVESPPVRIELPDAASSGAPNPRSEDEQAKVSYVDSDQGDGASRGRKRKASALLQSGAEIVSKRRKPNPAEDATNDRNYERANLSGKLRWHLGPAHRLLDIAEEAFLRLQQSFLAQQQQFSSAEPLQLPEYLEVRPQLKSVLKSLSLSFPSLGSESDKEH